MENNQNMGLNTIPKKFNSLENNLKEEDIEYETNDNFYEDEEEKEFDENSTNIEENRENDRFNEEEQTKNEENDRFNKENEVGMKRLEEFENQNSISNEKNNEEKQVNFTNDSHDSSTNNEINNLEDSNEKLEEINGDFIDEVEDLKKDYQDYQNKQNKQTENEVLSFLDKIDTEIEDRIQDKTNIEEKTQEQGTKDIIELKNFLEKLINNQEKNNTINEIKKLQTILNIVLEEKQKFKEGFLSELEELTKKIDSFKDFFLDKLDKLILKEQNNILEEKDNKVKNYLIVTKNKSRVYIDNKKISEFQNFLVKSDVNMSIPKDCEEEYINYENNLYYFTDENNVNGVNIDIMDPMFKIILNIYILRKYKNIEKIIFEF